MVGTCAGDQSQARGHGKWSPKEPVSTPVMPPSGGESEGATEAGFVTEPPPPPASGSWREEANDAGAFHVDSGLASPDGSYGNQWWGKDPECPRHWPRTAPPGRTPPNPLGTELPCPGDGSLESPALGTPPRHLWRWGELRGPQPPLGPPLLSNHQRA